MTKHPFSKNCEPTIGELLNGPIAGLLMARDRVKVTDVVELAKNAKAALWLRDQ